MDVQRMMDDLLKKSKAAQAVLETYNQEQVDALCKAICLAFKEHAIELSKEVVEETRLGNYEHKVIKNTGTPDSVWSALKGKKSVGIIDEDPSRGLMFVAQPKGVVVVVAPTTNPNITALCNAALCIKGRNTCIICAHPRAKKTTKHTVDIMNAAMKKLGAPAHIIQVIEEPSIELTQAMMKAGDVIIATGGMGMVKAAYSSGKPSYGVGAGNVQAILDRDFDYAEAVPQIVLGRSFDNGLICACNQSAIMPREKADEIIALFQQHGAFYVHTPEDIAKVRNAVFVDGKPNPNAVGQSAQFIAQLAGIDVPETTQILLVQGDDKKVGAAELLCGEKMCPVLITIPYDTFDDALYIARSNLLYNGAGHTAVIHSNNQEHINKMAVSMPVCRLLINQPGIAAANPFGNNALTPTTTLGCGSWGNNSVDENLTYRYLLNITQVARINPSYKEVSEKELYS